MLGAISSSFQTRSEPQPIRRGVGVVAEREVVLGLEPAMIRAAKFVEWSAFDHRIPPGKRLLVRGKRYRTGAVI